MRIKNGGGWLFMIFAHLAQSENSVYWMLDDASYDIVNENIKQWKFSHFLTFEHYAMLKWTYFYTSNSKWCQW